MSLSRSQIAHLLTGSRLAIGIGAWTMPRLAGRLLGLDFAGNPQAPYLARLVGARDVALAVGAWRSRGATRRRWLRLALVCDAGDALAGVAGGRAGYLPPVTCVLVTGSALAAVALGALGDRPGAPTEPIAVG